MNVEGMLVHSIEEMGAGIVSSMLDKAIAEVGCFAKEPFWKLMVTGCYTDRLTYTILQELKEVK